MTITFLAPDGVPVTATQERQAKAAQYGGGAGRPLGARSGWRVDTAADTFTATSTTWTLKPSAALIDQGYGLHQGAYGWATDQNITGSVNAADATLTRYDRVWIPMNDSTGGDPSGTVSATPIYVAGTPGSGAPALPPRCFLVGDITVPAAGSGSPTATLNPARFAAAGAPLPVVDATERDGIADKYVGLQVLRKDKNGRVETWNGSVWWYVGKTDTFTRPGSTDSNAGDITGTTSLMTGTITAAPAGSYRIYGRASLYATSGVSRGYVYVKANATTDESRTDFTGDSNPKSWPTEFIYTHSGGDLVVTVGYRVTAGSPIVTGQASGITRVTATLLGN